MKCHCCGESDGIEEYYVKHGDNNSICRIWCNRCQLHTQELIPEDFYCSHCGCNDPIQLEATINYPPKPNITVWFCKLCNRVFSRPVPSKNIEIKESETEYVDAWGNDPVKKRLYFYGKESE